MVGKVSQMQVSMVNGMGGNASESQPTKAHVKHRLPSPLVICIGQSAAVEQGPRER
jgi:hypothetical protein